MSYPIRRWLKDLLQYGRRSVQSPGDGKSPLLWAADLPRLGRMWFSHCWFRTWLDLRQTPPRVVYDPQEVFSPDVRLIRPTMLQPIRPIQQSRRAVVKLRAWLADGGLERIFGRLGRRLAGGIVGTLGLVVFGLFGVIGTLLAGLVGLFGASALGTLLGADALGRRMQTLAMKTGHGLQNVRDGVTRGFTHVAGQFRNPREVLWTLATLTGTTGLILLMVLQAGGLPGTTTRATAADSHTVHRPSMELAQSDSGDDLYGGLPDPFAPSDAPPPQAEPPSDGFDDPFGPAPVDLTESPPAGADLKIDIARTPLPPEVARFDIPDDPAEFLVVSEPSTIDVLDLPADAWLRSLSRNEASRQPIIPAAYRESAIAPLPAVTLPEPIDSGDQFTPASRNIGVTIRKTQPEVARPGELLWYDLIVTNHSDEPVAGLVVEEQVAEPHRVADAQPAAAYRDGVLTWQLDGLEPAEEQRLSVAVYPMSNDEIATTAAVRSIATFSAVTLVQAETPIPEPVIEEPPADDLLIEEPPSVEERPIVQEPPIVEERPVDVPPAEAAFRRIKIVMTTPDRVRDGAGCVIQFEVTNTGTAPLSGVVVRGLLPESLRHRHGESVESAFGDLAPGETKHAELQATAAATGEAEIIAEVSTTEGVATTVRGSFTVVEQLRTLSVTDDFRPAGNVR